MRDLRLILIVILAVLYAGRNFDLPSIIPGGKVTQVTYVYERLDNTVPAPVRATLRALNEEGEIKASAVDRDSVDGRGEVPDQYKIAFEAAKDLPALVVQAGEKVLKIVHDPQTEDDVRGALK